MADWGAFEPEAMLRVLAARGVDFVVIGGLAAVLHGSARITQDLDITYSTEPANLDALGQALGDLDAKLYGVDADLPFVADARMLDQVEILTLATKLGKLDLLSHPEGAREFSELRRRAELISLGSMAVRIVAPADLISMKRSAGRTKDLADIEELEALLDLRD